jgi:acyl dehydratase
MSKVFEFFEDYEAGQKGITAGGFGSRTVSQTDLNYFAYLTADYHRNHLDADYMSDSIYGVTVAHGMLGSSLAVGMLSLCCPPVVGRDVPGAYLYDFSFDYKKGIKTGETISVKWEITGKAEETEYDGFGMVKTACEIVDKDDVALYEGTLSILVKKEKCKDARLVFRPGAHQEVEPFVADPDMEYYAEDYPLIKGGVTSGRTYNEADVVNYCGLVSDFNPLYVDVDFARKGPYGERIVPSMLIFTGAFGQWSRERLKCRDPKINVAGHLNDKGTFFCPVMIGDTIRVRYWTESSRVSRKNPAVGITVTRLQMINQRDEVVQDGSVVLMIPSREGLKADSMA